jgi:hypothetical protein
MEKRILLQENRELGNEIKNDLIQFKPCLAQLKATFEKLELSNFTDDQFKTMLLIGTQQVKPLYINTLNQDLDNLKIKNSDIRNNMIAGCNENIEKLEYALDCLKKFKPKNYTSGRPDLTLKQISFIDGNFVVSELDFENILEKSCRIYIETPEEFEFYNIVKDLSEQFNKYLNVLTEVGIVTSSKYASLVYGLNINEKGLSSVSAPGIKNVLSFKKRKAEYDNFNK